MQKMPAAGYQANAPGWMSTLAAATALAAINSGCSQFGPSCNTSDEANPAARYEEGTASGGVYMSSPWSGPLLYFPGGKRHDLVHKLRLIPRGEISVWESFSEQEPARALSHPPLAI